MNPLLKKVASFVGAAVLIHLFAIGEYYVIRGIARTLDDGQTDAEVCKRICPQ